MKKLYDEYYTLKCKKCDIEMILKKEQTAKQCLVCGERLDGTSRYN